MNDFVATPTVLLAELPAPPALEHWALEQPLPLAGALLLGGIVGFVLGMRRDQARAGAGILAAGIALAASVFGLAWMVTTPREEIAAETRRLIERTAASDDLSVGQLLSDNVVLVSSGAMASFGKDDLLMIVRGFHEFRISEWDQKLRGASIDGPGTGRTEVLVRARTEYAGGMFVPSVWQMGWRRSGEGWRVSRIECLSISGARPPGSWMENALRMSSPGPRGRGSGMGVGETRPQRMP